MGLALLEDIEELLEAARKKPEPTPDLEPP